jgi:hypothetical protein
MMNDQEILNNAPEGAICIRFSGDFYRWKLSEGQADYSIPYDTKKNNGYYERSLSDIKRIVELEDKNQLLKNRLNLLEKNCFDETGNYWGFKK